MTIQLPRQATGKADLSELQRKQLAAAVTVIVKTVAPEKIICFGSRSLTRTEWGCFVVGGGDQELVSTEYYLLIITAAGENRAEHELIQMIEQRISSPDCRFISLIHKLPAVNEAIEKGSRFFSAVCHSGMLLYDGSGLPLEKPAELSVEALKHRMEESWQKWFATAEGFYQTAVHSLQNNMTKQCVFLLHQSVEAGCAALLKSLIGYRCHTHNLSRLLALTGCFSARPSAIFPLNTKEESDLFNLLRTAYSDARYNADFTVTTEKATLLMERVKQFLNVAEQLYREKLGSLDAEAAISFPITVNGIPQGVKIH